MRCWNASPVTYLNTERDKWKRKDKGENDQMKEQTRKRELFNSGWRFTLDDLPSFSDESFDDSSWKELTLPHDWSQDYPLDENSPVGGAGGYAKAGTGWYRKTFDCDPGEGKVFLVFDGIYMDSTVYVNGVKAGGCGYGYIGFEVDVTGLIKKGRNTVAVRVNNSNQPNSRWYSGSGIYRNVWFEETARVHMARFGVRAQTNGIYPEKDVAGIQIKARIKNDSDKTVDTGVMHRLYDRNGDQVSFSGTALKLAPGETGDTMVVPVISSPHLWSDEDPYLYTLKSTVVVDGVPVDEVSSAFGIRTAEFDADRGFLLNGRQVKIKGMCLHHDCGLTGAVGYRNTWERRLRRLKDMGCNGIRCAHNPPSPEFLELCDELGFLVMDEIFDEWMLTKDKIHNYYSETFAYGSSQFFENHAEEELMSMLMRDFNHPSVILWSIGNEIPEQSADDGVRILRFLRDICHREDTSRMVTAACDNIASVAPYEARRAFENELDVVGYNYVDRWRGRAETLYEEDRKLFPERRFCGSENASAGGVRGDYSTPEGRSRVFRDYRLVTLKHEWLWRYTASRDFVAGDFLWTGIDYLGETQWPMRGSGSGPIDTAGFPKDTYYYFRSLWNDKEITLHLLPHWNWQGQNGEFKQVIAYTNCDEVKLYINGRYVGRRSFMCPSVGARTAWNDVPKISPTTHDLHLTWDVPFEEGELIAVGYKNGEIVATETVRTTKEISDVVLKTDKETIKPGDVCHIDISSADEDGLFVPDASVKIECEVTGAGHLVGMDSGDLSDKSMYSEHTRKMFNGLLMAMVYADRPGTIEIKIRPEGLEERTVTVNVEG